MMCSARLVAPLFQAPGIYYLFVCLVPDPWNLNNLKSIGDMDCV